MYQRISRHFRPPCNERPRGVPARSARHHAKRQSADRAHRKRMCRRYARDRVETGQAAQDVHGNVHQGKVGVLCLAPEEGLGVRDDEMRTKHIGAINRFRGA